MLELIGAGFGRTGTLSLRTALERLGYGPCYHMFEVFANPSHALTWRDAHEGRPVDWRAHFDTYRATVDWPACVFWRDILEAHPDAKVLLSVRPPDRWLASFKATIYEVTVTPPPIVATLPPEFETLVDTCTRIVGDRSFGDLAGLSDDEIVAAYERHNAEVRADAPADRFLEFDVAEGWGPLCELLGVPVPDEPFPNVHDTAQFRQSMGLDPVPEE
jgi:hypothetical protein